MIVSLFYLINRVDVYYFMWWYYLIDFDANVVEIHKRNVDEFLGELNELMKRI